LTFEQRKPETISLLERLLREPSASRCAPPWTAGLASHGGFYQYRRLLRSSAYKQEAPFWRRIRNGGECPRAARRRSA
jgi:hypothetical protein